MLADIIFGGFWGGQCDQAQGAILQGPILLGSSRGLFGVQCDQGQRELFQGLRNPGGFLGGGEARRGVSWTQTEEG